MISLNLIKVIPFLGLAKSPPSRDGLLLGLVKMLLMNKRHPSLLARLHKMTDSNFSKLFLWDESPDSFLPPLLTLLLQMSD